MKQSKIKTIFQVARPPKQRVMTSRAIIDDLESLELFLDIIVALVRVRANGTCWRMWERVGPYEREWERVKNVQKFWESVKMC